jgi:rhamnogalacturonyl hydrolase YesR
LRAHAKGVASVQGGDGMWHQLLDRPDTFPETSCTAMFSYAMARGVNNGWLDAGSYGPVALVGFNALTAHVSEDGKLDSVCVGTGFADDPTYYYNRPAVDDVHGYGAVLLAGSEIIRMLKNDQLRITGSANGPIMVHQQ